LDNDTLHSIIIHHGLVVVVVVVVVTVVAVPVLFYIKQYLLLTRNGTFKTVERLNFKV